MLTRWLRYCRAHWLACCLLLLLSLMVGINALAFRHAWAMTHFVPGATRTKEPDALSLTEKAWVLVAGVRLPKPINDRTPGDDGLSFETRRFHGTDGVDLEAWYVPAKSPRAIVLLFHGYGSGKMSQISSASILNDLGCDCLLVDFRGAGGSAGNRTSLGYLEANDVAGATRLARELQPRLPCVLLGTSMGAAASLRAVGVLGVDVDAMIVECPFDSLVSTAKNRFDMMGVPSFPFAELLVFWGGVQLGEISHSHNPAEYARNVRVPVLQLHGEKDTRVTLPQARCVHGNLAGPKEFVSFPKVGHESYSRRVPQEWKNTVGKFLAARVFRPTPVHE